MQSRTYALRARRRRGLLAIGSAAALTGLAVLAAVTLAGNGTSDAGPVEPVHFQARVKTAVQRATPPVDSEIRQSRVAIVEVLDRWYQTAFVDREQWDDPSFAPMTELMTPEAAAAFPENIASLTLGATAAEVERVVPGVAEVNLTMYFDMRAKAQLAIAEVTFAATGTLRDESAPPLVIEQTATLSLERTPDDRWVVFAYEAIQNQVSATEDGS